MKNCFLCLLVLIFVISCDDSKIKNLNNRISYLEAVNKNLRDSLNNVAYMRIISSELIGIPEKSVLIPNQPNKFTFMLKDLHQDLPEYSVYLITKDGKKEEKELLYKNIKKPEFEFNFIPKDEKEKSFELSAEFDLDSVEVRISGAIDMSQIE